MLRASELDVGFQLGSHQSRARGRIPCLDLLAMLLFMQHRVQLAFWAASTHCWLVSRAPPSPSQ